jgi:hypothetical protein
LSGSVSFASGTPEIKPTIPASNSLAFLNPSKPTSSVTLPSLSGLATGTSSLFGTTNTAIPATSTKTNSQPNSTTTATTTPGGGLNFGTSSFSLSTKPAETTTATSTTTPATTTTAQPALTLSTGTSAQTTTSTNDIKPTIGLFSTPKSENKTTTTSLTNQQQQRLQLQVIYHKSCHSMYHH